MVQHMHVLSVACSALRELFSASGLIDKQHTGLVPIRPGQIVLCGDVEVRHGGSSPLTVFPASAIRPGGAAADRRGDRRAAPSGPLHPTGAAPLPLPAGLPALGQSPGLRRPDRSRRRGDERAG